MRNDGAALRWRDYRRRSLWFFFRWGMMLGVILLCVYYVYPHRLINDSPDAFVALPGRAAALVPIRDTLLFRLLAWFPEEVVLPAVYPRLHAYILPGREYAWLLLLVGCMIASVLSTSLILLLWRILSRVGIRAARRARRAALLLLLVAALVIALNAALALLIMASWTAGHPAAPPSFWDGLMSCSVFLCVPLVSLLSAWRAAPACIAGKRCFFR